MNELVELKNGKVVTTSLKIAEYFGKQHFHILRDIENLGCSEEFRQSNFGLSSYLTSQNKMQPFYEITRDGFTLLAMGYNGEKAMKFKEEYINQFNKMEGFIREIQSNPANPLPTEIENRNIKAINSSVNILADAFRLSDTEKDIYLSSQLRRSGIPIPEIKSIEVKNESEELFPEKRDIYKLFKGATGKGSKPIQDSIRHCIDELKSDNQYAIIQLTTLDNGKVIENYRYRKCIVNKIQSMLPDLVLI